MKKILSVFGTRPEAIKAAPVVTKLAEFSSQFESKVCVTAQHCQMLDQVLDLFAIRPNYDLDIMQPGQNLADVPGNVPVNIKQQWFLDQMRQGIPCRSADIAAKWGVVEKTAKRDISDLQKKNLIVFVGPAKTGSYQLK